MKTTKKELIEMFGVDGKIPETEPCIEGVDYDDQVVVMPSNIDELIAHAKSDKNVGNRYAKGPPKGSRNALKKYWYKTPFGEGIVEGKDKLVSLGFPPSIHARKDRHYIGGASYRNKALAGYEFKTLNNS